MYFVFFASLFPQKKDFWENFFKRTEPTDISDVLYQQNHKFTPKEATRMRFQKQRLLASLLFISLCTTAGCAESGAFLMGDSTASSAEDIQDIPLRSIDADVSAYSGDAVGTFLRKAVYRPARKRRK